MKTITSSEVSSFLVANHIAKAEKPFTNTKELILRTVKDICLELIGDSAVQKVPLVPLLTSTLAP